jgi:hypothetical protein
MPGLRSVSVEFRREDIRHHLNALESLRSYNPKKAGVAPDLTSRMASIENVSATLDPRAPNPLARLDGQEFDDLIRFVRTGLLDERALPSRTCQLVPASLPSGAPVSKFENCR